MRDVRFSTLSRRLAQVVGRRFSLIFGGVAAACGIAQLAVQSIPSTSVRLVVGLALALLGIAAAASIGRYIAVRLARIAEFATDFAEGDKTLRLPQRRGIAGSRDFAEILNAIADLVQDRELQFSLLSEATGDLVWDWDIATDAVTCRGGANKAIGLERDKFEFPNDWWLDRIHPDDRLRIEESFGVAFLDGRRLWSEVYRFRHEDGGYRCFWDRGVIVHGNTGEPVRVIGCMTDVSSQRKAEEATRASERRYRSLVLAISSVVWSSGPDGRIVASHQPWEALTGQTEAEYRDLGWLEAFHPDDREALSQAWRDASRIGVPYAVKARLLRVDGAYRWVVVRGAPVRDATGSVEEWVGVIVDVHEEHQASLELVHKTEELAQRVRQLDCIHSVALACNQDELPVEHVLQEAASALPPALNDSAAACCEIACGDDVFSSHPGRAIVMGATHPIQAGGIEVGKVRLGYAPGTRGKGISPEERELLRTAAALLGQMLSQRADRDRTWHTANHDVLTGLPNRARFQADLDAEFERDDGASELALLLIDLDQFKDVNDTLGHDAGDALLAATGERLQLAIGDRGLVARLGGDEFAVLLANADLADVVELGRKLLTEIRHTVRFAGRDISANATIGAAMAPLHARSAKDLLKTADIALYVGKSSGRNGLSIYEPTMRDMIEQRIRICAEVRESLATDVFVPYYQPKVSLQTRQITGFEALLRWKHPARGLQTAAAVAPAFEDHELALGLGERIRQKVFADMSVWRQRGVIFHNIAVNLSSPEFDRADLAEHILGQLQTAGLPASCLGIEVTETVLMGREADAIGPILQKLHDAGVQIALDDFGTGYASLTHLQRYPVDVIKIDQSFVRSILTDPGSQAITSAVLELGRRLGMTVVAEGVETAAHAELLRASGCDQAQGFYFAKATPASRVPYILGGSERISWSESGKDSASAA